MSLEIEIRRPEYIKSHTDILSTAIVTDDEGKDHVAEFERLLVLYGQEYLESINQGCEPIFLIDDFEDNALREGITNWDAFEEAFQSKHWSTVHWKDMVTTRIEPMSLCAFQQHSKYFTRVSDGSLVFLEDDLTLAAWFESEFIISKDEKTDFVRWCFEEGMIK